MSATPEQLKADAQSLLKDAEIVIGLVEGLPVLPAEVKVYVAKADAFIRAVEAFLSA
jgi:hypothetical protein